MVVVKKHLKSDPSFVSDKIIHAENHTLLYHLPSWEQSLSLRSIMAGICVQELEA